VHKQSSEIPPLKGLHNAIMPVIMTTYYGLQKAIQRNGGKQMADYASMYKKLFNAQADIIEILQNAHRDAEEIYINTTESEIEAEEEI